MFDPRTEEEIHQEMFAIAQEQSDLSDTTDTAIANAVLKSNAAQFELVEQRQASLYRSLGLDAEGQDLDDVVGQWPGFEPRGGQSPAQGAIMELYRDTTSGDLGVAAGVVVGSRSGKRYVLPSAVQFLDGHATMPGPGQSYAYAVASAPGTEGNCDAGAISQVLQGPDELIGCRNVYDLSNGQARETDAQLRKRALDWLAGGVTRLPERGLLAVVRAFRGSDGTRIRHASIWVDPVRPYAEVIVDDGRGFVGFSAPAKVYSGTVPANGQLDFWFDAPLVGDEVTLKVNGVPVSPVQWVTLHERGRAWLDEAADFWEPGDTWECSGHQVYIRVLRELQAVIEGVLAWNGRDVGFRATAMRVRVRTSLPEEVAYHVVRTIVPGYDPSTVDAQIRNAIVEFHLDLEQGQQLQLFHLIPRLEALPGLDNCALLDADDPSLAMQDVSPASRRHKLTTSEALIYIAGA